MQRMLGLILVWIGTLALILVAVSLLPVYVQVREVPFSTFWAEGSAGAYRSVTLTGQEAEGFYKVPVKGAYGEDIQRFHTIAPAMPELGRTLLDWQRTGRLEEFGAGREPTPQVFWLGSLLAAGLLWSLWANPRRGEGRQVLEVGKARVRTAGPAGPRVTFADVAGCGEAKQEMREIVDYLQDPARFVKLGGRLPGGVLLVGPPGTGKTLLARAIAGEAGVPCYAMAGSEFVELYAGVGAARVRDLFEQGRRNAPCILFLDELDAVGRRRDPGPGGGSGERDQTLNQLLVELDGFQDREGVILIAATNRPDVLDPALLRPGRFGRRVMVDRPDLQGRLEILRVHVAGRIPLAPDVELELLARSTPGCNGADLACLCNEAALHAARRGGGRVAMDDFEQARDRVCLGGARRTLDLGPADRRRAAYHEAGHATVAASLPGSDPVHRVSLGARGRDLGATLRLPARDRQADTRERLEGEIAVLMAGRVAEEAFCGGTSTGAAADIERASAVARRMVCVCGMSERLGPVRFGPGEPLPVLGRDLSPGRDYSEATARTIDAEVRAIVLRNVERARAIVLDRREALAGLAEALLARGTLDAGAVRVLLEARATSPATVPDIPSRPAGTR